jgi:hypothetical protein
MTDLVGLVGPAYPDGAETLSLCVGVSIHDTSASQHASAEYRYTRRLGTVASIKQLYTYILSHSCISLQHLSGSSLDTTIL